MEHMSTGLYERLPQPDIALQNYVRIPHGHSSGPEVVADPVKAMTASANYTTRKIPLCPVYVNEDDELVYDSKRMEKGKKYRITWCGEHFMLIKDDDGVSVYVFEADND